MSCPLCLDSFSINPFSTIQYKHPRSRAEGTSCTGIKVHCDCLAAYVASRITSGYPCKCLHCNVDMNPQQIITQLEQHKEWFKTMKTRAGTIVSQATPYISAAAMIKFFAVTTSAKLVPYYCSPGFYMTSGITLFVLLDHVSPKCSSQLVNGMVYLYQCIKKGGTRKKTKKGGGKTMTMQEFMDYKMMPNEIACVILPEL